MNLPITKLSRLDAHDWAVVSNAWARFGPQHWIRKRGRRWLTEGAFAGPELFDTKRAASEHIDHHVLSESHNRAERTAGSLAGSGTIPWRRQHD